MRLSPNLTALLMNPECPDEVLHDCLLEEAGNVAKVYCVLGRSFSELRGDHRRALRDLGVSPEGPRMISLDTETTGVDLYHGAKPFFIVSCDLEGEVTYWQWDVDPSTREPAAPKQDLQEIGDLIFGPAGDDGPQLVLQNPKFDVAALATLLPEFSWPWERTFCTLLAGHLLASNHRHDLTSMALAWLGKDIEPFELALKDACNAARRVVRSQLAPRVTVDLFSGESSSPEWRIAGKDQPDMPSAKDSAWKFDTWLPRAVALELGYPDDHPWMTVLRDYAVADAETTLQLFLTQRQEIERRGLGAIYAERLKVLPVAHSMERTGVTASAKRLEQLRAEYRRESAAAGDECVEIARSFGYDLKLPKSGNNNSLLHFCFGEPQEAGGSKQYLDLPVVEETDTGRPSLSKPAMDAYEDALEHGGVQHRFVKALRAKRKRDTALSYMEGYERYWQPLESHPEDWRVLHPNLNPTGTDTLRWSSNNPNEQNISKQEGFNLRLCFGPAPGREWWSLDAKNIELRIPTFECGEEALMEVFLHPERPPYFGSYHLVIADLLHPEEFKKHGKRFKDVHESTLYQWVKNGNFAVIYGAQEETADRTYHVRGAYKRIRHRFPKIAQLSDRMLAKANRDGFVETIPDKSVDPKRGYPVLCSRSERGEVLPTVPLNYHTQSTACWWMMKAMIRCHGFLESLNRGNRFLGREWPGGYRIALQVHDELVFDFPKGRGKEPWQGNLPVIKELARLMEQGGDGIGVPTPVTVEYHVRDWSTGKVINV